ncbi:hypothetical protein PR048_032152 [Dryococelus australis]|uniref:Uncharacterized protein n=1 Tax=Dryococelus australis TaxID=614101 RepID=A0ABQ9G5I4_9NEOP|nr:hypothetical protein PR048_032152 [Dryococelus australis]
MHFRDGAPKQLQPSKDVCEFTVRLQGHETRHDASQLPHGQEDRIRAYHGLPPPKHDTKQPSASRLSGLRYKLPGVKHSSIGFDVALTVWLGRQPTDALLVCQAHNAMHLVYIRVYLNWITTRQTPCSKSKLSSLSHYGQKWIGRGGPIAWPARSPDLTPLDHFWGHMKGLIYKTPVESEEDLLAQIMAVADLGLPGICDCVYQNMVHRYRVCVDVAGRHIEPFFLDQSHVYLTGWCSYCCWLLLLVLPPGVLVMLVIARDGLLWVVQLPPNQGLAMPSGMALPLRIATTMGYGSPIVLTWSENRCWEELGAHSHGVMLESAVGAGLQLRLALEEGLLMTTTRRIEVELLPLPAGKVRVVCPEETFEGTTRSSSVGANAVTSSTVELHDIGRRTQLIVQSHFGEVDMTSDLEGKSEQYKLVRHVCNKAPRCKAISSGSVGFVLKNEAKLHSRKLRVPLLQPARWLEEGGDGGWKQPLCLVEEGCYVLQLAPTQLSYAVIGDPPRPPLFLERCARGLLIPLLTSLNPVNGDSDSEAIMSTPFPEDCPIYGTIDALQEGCAVPQCIARGQHTFHWSATATAGLRAVCCTSSTEKAGGVSPEQVLCYPFYTAEKARRMSARECLH